MRVRKASAAHGDVRDDLRALQNTPLLQTKLLTRLFLVALGIKMDFIYPSGCYCSMMDLKSIASNIFEVTNEKNG